MLSDLSLTMPTRAQQTPEALADFRAVAEATLAAGHSTGYVPTGGADTLVTLLESMY